MNKESAEYKEALAIIQSGKEQLAAKPRADMEGFVPSGSTRRRSKNMMSVPARRPSSTKPSAMEKRCMIRT
jgi:hypothetical protein